MKTVKIVKFDKLAQKTIAAVEAPRAVLTRRECCWQFVPFFREKRKIEGGGKIDWIIPLLS